MIACLDGKENFVKRNQMNAIQSLVETMAPAWTFSTAIGKPHSTVTFQQGQARESSHCFVSQLWKEM